VEEINIVDCNQCEFGCIRDEMIGGWRKLHNEELHSWRTSLIIIVIIIMSLTLIVRYDVMI
jgi:hypothetical protein